jgi:hypothetical protein
VYTGDEGMAAVDLPSIRDTAVQDSYEH